MSIKRIAIATLTGAACGLVCFALASGGKEPLPWQIAVQIIASRTLIGFALGTGCVKLGHWALRGPVFGLLFSLPLAFSGLMAPESPEFTHGMIFASTLVMGLIYGLLIEVVTSVLFKAPLEQA